MINNIYYGIIFPVAGIFNGIADSFHDIIFVFGKINVHYTAHTAASTEKVSMS